MDEPTRQVGQAAKVLLRRRPRWPHRFRARKVHEVVTTVVPFAWAVHAIIEARTYEFCKLIVDRARDRIGGCPVVRGRAVELAQLAAVAIAAGRTVDDLARAAISFPTYAEFLVHASVRVAVWLGVPLRGQSEHVGVRR